MNDFPDQARLERAIARNRRSATDSSARRRAESFRQELALAGYHQARLLILLAAVAGPNGRVSGLTKIAKLDFLVRYPVFLQELLTTLGHDVLAARVGTTDDERRAVESRMIRYKYGPWDDRYYGIVGALIGRGLLEYVGAPDQLSVRVTPGGQAVAATVRSDPSWSRVAIRSEIIRDVFGKLSGNAIKDLIYTHLPGVVDRPHRTEI